MVLIPKGERGFFISFESIDGLGKTTQVKTLADNLQQSGYNVALTKEPGDKNWGSNVGAGVRNLVFKDPTTLKMRPGVADLLFLADHVQNAGDIAELVEAGKVVITDRYADSQFAYNASAGKKCPDWAMKAFGEQFGIVPDMTILLVARGPEMPSGLVPQGMGGIEDISWALARGKARKGDEAGKQDGKAWNNVKDQMLIQEEYLKRLGKRNRTFEFHVWEHMTPRDISVPILSEVLNRIGKLTVSSVQEAA